MSGILTRLFERRFWPGSEAAGMVWRDIFNLRVDDSGVVVTPHSSLQTAAVYACIRILAETVASLPLPIYQRLPDGGKRRAVDHPLYTILHDQPNGEMSSFEFREVLMAHLLLWGNAYAEIERTQGGRVAGLWPLRPDRMQVVRVDGDLGYAYRQNEKEAPVGLAAANVLHLRGLGGDGIVGYSPIELMRRPIGLAMATEKFGSKFYSNSARPGLILTHPGVLGDEAYNNLLSSWETRHQGLDNAHRIAILEEGMSVEQVGIPPQDAQYLETRKFQVTEIARMYRVPPHMLADLERATFSNIEHQSLEFVMHSVRPWLVRWEQGMQRQLLMGDQRYFAEFLVDGLLRGDIASRYQAYATGRQNGWLSANDVRRLENMNPIDGGDTYLVPLNMVPADMVGSLRSADVEQLDRPALLAIAPEIESRATAEERQRGSALSRQRLQKAQMKIFTDAAGRVLRREANDVANAARRLLGRRSLAEFDQWLREFYADFELTLREMWQPAAMAYAEMIINEAVRELGLDEIDEDRVRRFVFGYVNAFASRHVIRSEDQIRAILAAGGDDMAGEIEAITESWRSPEKAATIALEESVRQNNAVAVTVYGIAGVVALRWISLGDSCPYCRNLNGRQVGISEWFLAAGESFDPDGAERPLQPNRNIGHPPAHQGCDCMVVAGI